MILFAGIAVVSVIKIIGIISGEAKQRRELQALHEEYVSKKISDVNFTDEPKSGAMSVETIDESEGILNDTAAEDAGAWYHDIDVDLKGLREINPDIGGWIYFENEKDISYPLLYSGDDHYLHYNYFDEEEAAGSIFIDAVNNPALSDVHTLIYGHNMRNLTMFGKLKYYKTS